MSVVIAIPHDGWMVIIGLLIGTFCTYGTCCTVAMDRKIREQYAASVLENDQNAKIRYLEWQLKERGSQ